MQEKTESTVQGEGGDRRLLFGAVRVHNAHLQGGRTAVVGCGVCSQGLAGAMGQIAQERTGDKPVEVAPRDGADGEGDSASPHSSWEDR